MSMILVLIQNSFQAINKSIKNKTERLAERSVYINQSLKFNSQQSFKKGITKSLIYEKY